MKENENVPVVIEQEEETALSTELVELSARAKEFASLGMAENTQRAYRSDWDHFVSWCDKHERSALPADDSTVILYITDMSEKLKISTIERRMVSINKAHRVAGKPEPGRSEKVFQVWRGMKRAKGKARKGVRPLLLEHLIEICESLGSRLIEVRDRAILLLGFTAALRRSELVALDLDDLNFTTDGLIVTIRRSKTDQEGEGRAVGVPYGKNPNTCPVLAVETWIRRAYLENGPLFRAVDKYSGLSDTRLNDRTVAHVVKRLMKLIGIDPTNYSGHSLRSGLATSAAQAGVSERLIMNQTGHRSLAVVRQYIRDGSLFRDNAVSKMGL
jgi:integrase